MRRRLAVARKVPCAPRRLDVVRRERAVLHRLAAAERVGEDGRPVVHKVHAERDDEGAADGVPEERGGLVEPEAPDRRGGAVHESSRDEEHLRKECVRTCICM